jgi:O-antigen/teichoic acid export membrane protein
MIGVPRAVTRLGWGLADQALTSLSNFALSAIVARTVGPIDFGAFSLGFAAYLTTISISRALVAQPLLVRYSGSSLSDWRRASSSATGTALLLGVTAGVMCVIAALFVHGILGDVLLAVGVAMPGLLVLDIWRYAFFAAARGISAFIVDMSVVVLLFTSLGLIAVSGSVTVVWPILLWGGSAATVAIGTALRVGVLPRPFWARKWWTGQRELAGRYVAEAATDSVATMVTYNGIALIAGLAAVGALRAATLVLGPVGILLQGTNLVAIAEAVRLLKRSRRRLRNGCLLLSAVLTGATVTWGAVSFAIPDNLGQTLLGPTWESARGVLLPAVVATAGTSASVGAWVGLRALGAARQSLRARIIHSLVMLMFALGGATILGTQGAAWGLAGTAWFGAGLWSLQFAFSLRDYAPSSGSEPTNAPVIGG